MEKVISKTDLDLQVTTPGSRQQMVAGLARSIELSSETRTLFTISYRNPNPQARARRGAGAARHLHREHHRHRPGRSRECAALPQPADRLLRAAVARRRAAARGVQGQVRGPAALDRIWRSEQARNSARGAVSALQGQLADALAQRETLKKELAATPQFLPFSSLGGPSANAMALAEAERKLALLRLQYTEQDPDVIAQRQLVEALRSGKMGSLTAAPPAGRPAANASSGEPNVLYQDFKLKLVDTDVGIASLRAASAGGGRGAGPDGEDCPRRARGSRPATRTWTATTTCCRRTTRSCWRDAESATIAQAATPKPTRSSSRWSIRRWSRIRRWHRTGCCC